MTGAARPRDPHARPADPGVRELDAAGAGAERRAVRAAIESLRLAPVMFELGARPHPPRELYRAYLEQSDVFVGMYGRSYGWVAPGEEISGLEDEYHLAPDGDAEAHLRQGARPAKQAERADRTDQGDDTVSYMPFSTAEELAERVDGRPGDAARRTVRRRARQPRAPRRDHARARIPAPYTKAVGRERDLATLLACCSSRDGRAARDPRRVRAGSERAASRSRSPTAPADAFDREVTFVSARAGPRPGTGPGRDRRGSSGSATRASWRSQLRIARAAGDRRMLIVLDNFEQILDAAPRYRRGSSPSCPARPSS